MISDCISIYDRNNRSISSYTLSPHYYKIFLELVLEINQKSKSRYNQNSRQYYKRDYQQKVKEEPKVKSTGNQRLDKILEKIKLREDQLSKMSKNDPNRSSLINELETYKNVANKMKSKIK
jgi:DNA-directed RNA polymerase subunit H (RpoH/RPB5)